MRRIVGVVVCSLGVAGAASAQGRPASAGPSHAPGMVFLPFPTIQAPGALHRTAAPAQPPVSPFIEFTRSHSPHAALGNAPLLPAIKGPAQSFTPPGAANRPAVAPGTSAASGNSPASAQANPSTGQLPPGQVDSPSVALAYAGPGGVTVEKRKPIPECK
jgi:hypothetical protein